MIVTVTGLASKSPALSVALTVKAYFRLEAVAALTKIFLAEIERFLCAVAGSGTTPLAETRRRPALLEALTHHPVGLDSMGRRR